MSGTAELVEDVLRTTPLIDGHNDWPLVLRARAGYSVEGLDEPRAEFHTDIPRLRAGRVGAQFWSVFVPSSLPEPEAVVATLEQIDAVHRLVARYPDTFGLACTAAELLAVFRSGRIAALLGAEGGHSIAGSLGVLRALARLGVRYLTLTHNNNTAWADSAAEAGRVGGLSDAGRAVVAELNRVGMLVDLSHTAEATQRAALEATRAPVIFSHSSVKAQGDHRRNVSDAVLRRLPANGGVVALTFVPAFLSPAYAEWSEAADEARGAGEEPWPRAPVPGQSAHETIVANAGAALEGLEDPADVAAREGRFREWLARHPRPAVGIGDVVRHIEHARDVAGVRHIGLGGDYDGIDRQPDGLTDVSGYPRLLQALAERGWSRGDLAALAGGNILRVLRDAEDVAEVSLWPAARA
ncbi:dipeptidase [Georgenia sp. SYP-B2076]|uniref:dipeptidase n=1 Tax=Georgenia sp. SYP-B2076 TaxID=2495881 RepID=UPI000F8DFF7B|nr:dipeptidase [Georgenia sp. SYP-B2076]